MIRMDEKRREQLCHHPRITAGVSVSITLVILLASAVSYGGYYALNKFDEMTAEINLLKQVNKSRHYVRRIIVLISYNVMFLKAQYSFSLFTTRFCF